MIKYLPASLQILELTNLTCLTDAIFINIATQLSNLTELSLKSLPINLNKGEAYIAFIELLRANHKTLLVLDLSGNSVTDQLIEGISNLHGLEVTKYRSSKLCLNELVLLHLKTMDMQ